MSPTRIRERRHARAARLAARTSLALVLWGRVVALAAVAGCGGSSKPSYCSDRSSLENSVKGLTSAATSGNVSALKSQVATIKSDATSLVNSAKSDFPSETSAIKSSVDTLDDAVTTLPSSPSAAQVVTVGRDAAGVVSSVKSFSDATSSKWLAGWSGGV